MKPRDPLPRAVVFDLDGTLLDTAPSSAAALNRALGTGGYRTLSLEEVHGMVGHGARAMLHKALTLLGGPVDDPAIDDWTARFVAAYLDDPASDTIIYPGVVETLAELQAADTVMGICTNKPRSSTIAVLEALGLDRYFAAVCCPEDVAHRKPDGRHVTATLTAMNAPAGAAAFVGDSETDMAAAADAGIPAVLVTYGYSHGLDGALPAATVIDRFGDLTAALRGIAAGKHTA